MVFCSHYKAHVQLGKVAGVNGNWYTIGVIVYTSIVSLAGDTPRERPLSISKEAHPFSINRDTPKSSILRIFTLKKSSNLDTPVYGNPQELINSRHQNPETTDLAKEYFDSPSDGFPFYQSHLQVPGAR